MDEGQVGKQGMMANLLVAAEGHLPGRKGDEKEVAGRQEMLDSGEQLPFVCNVLDDVVHQDKVEGFFCHWCILQDVGSEESTFCFGLTEETTCLFNTRGSQVDACHPATGLCERQKVATFAASYFQYTSLGRDVDKGLHIGNVVKAAGLYLLAEVEFSVLMSLLHVVLVLMMQQSYGLIYGRRKETDDMMILLNAVFQYIMNYSHDISFPVASMRSFMRRLRWATMPVSVLPKQRAMANVPKPADARQ